MDNNDNMFNSDKIVDIPVTEEVKTSFLNYAMSVIVSRALPDVRDGLKPVHRRILYAMNDLGVYAGKPYKKSARIVGDVIGKYHPHGDSSVYDALVRMAQSFSMSNPLIDGHGNFGSIDGDGAAAMRYTEARMSKLSMELLKDLGKDTVDFQENYDGSEFEPSVLPSKFPNLLVNGSSGIAVGMATNIPPHNLAEVIDGVIAYMDNPEITIAELMQYIKAPDFPTGGTILGLSGLRQAYETGNGSISIRAKTHIEEASNGKSSIVVTEIPYSLNKTKLIEKISELYKNKVIDGITAVTDESDRNGIRLVIELRRDINPHVMLNKLYKYTSLQTSYSINMVALSKKRPIVLNLKEALKLYVEHQVEVLTRKTEFDLKKAEARAHILEGLFIAMDNIDEVIRIIKESNQPKEDLMERFNLSEIQARAILEMRLRQLSNIEVDKIKAEYDQLSASIADYNDILGSYERKTTIIKTEQLEVKNRFGEPRRSILDTADLVDIDDEDLIPREDVIISVTHSGYVKRMTLDNFKRQNRGGTGNKGVSTKTGDFVEQMLFTSTHDHILFFTSKGRVYKLKGYGIPEGSKQAKGIPIVNLIQLDQGEKLASIINLQDFDQDDKYILFCTKRGMVKRTRVSEFTNIRQTGIIAMALKENDELLAARISDDSHTVIMGASNGKAIRYHENEIRIMGRSAGGVRGMLITEDDSIVGLTISQENKQHILVVTEKGYGKRSPVDDYRVQTRGGKGVKALNITEKNGALAKLRSVNDQEDILIATNKGVVIRLHCKDITISSRNTQGVRLMRLKDTQKVSTTVILPMDTDEDVDLFTDNSESEE